MLNATRVLKYVKSHLGFPFQQLELEDTEIMEHIKDFTLREFSQFIPEKKKIHLDFNNSIYKVPGRQNEYYIQDPQNLEILTVVEIYFDHSKWMFHGHQPYGVWSHGELKNWALAQSMAADQMMFSSFDQTFEFKHPNIVRISPVPSDVQGCTVEYERQQPPDFRGIPNEFQVFFCEMALADMMIVLGRIRKKYGDGTLRTPFGEIPLSAEILEEGKEKKREIIEKLTQGTYPNIIIDHG